MREYDAETVHALLKIIVWSSTSRSLCLKYFQSRDSKIAPHLEELVDVQIVTAVKIHEIECVVDVGEALFVVLTHVCIQHVTSLVKLLP